MSSGERLLFEGAEGSLASLFIDVPVYDSASMGCLPVLFGCYYVAVALIDPTNIFVWFKVVYERSKHNLVVRLSHISKVLPWHA